MKDQIKHWNKESFIAYLLIHAADADFEISTEEKKFILTVVSEDTYNNILSEYQKDNDYQGLEKIVAAKDYLCIDPQECATILEEIEDVFKADNNYNTLEHNYYIGIKKLLS